MTKRPYTGVNVILTFLAEAKNNWRQGYIVKAIEADHLVVEDITGVNEIHIPVYSIKAIVRVKLSGK